MTEVKIVIGANYGDEGKGLASNYFGKMPYYDQKVLNVLFNGGPQRGHTVDDAIFGRHVFHHFGCASSDCYFDENFMLYPPTFVIEWRQLKAQYPASFMPRPIIDYDCRVITPFDAILNQVIEASRGDKKHGTCGFGIWETQCRYEKSLQRLTALQLYELSDRQFIDYLDEIAYHYFPRRLRDYDITEVPPEVNELINSQGLREHFLKDFLFMCQHSEWGDIYSIAKNYDRIVFEGAQGLALDKNNIINYPHVTASSTTSEIPLKRVKAALNNEADVEICYVTRTYFTRHGAGPLRTECNKTEINPDIVDFTNASNEFQGTIRYGKFDKQEFFNRINADKFKAKIANRNAKFSLLISHLNYTNHDFCGDASYHDLSFRKNFDTIYLSDTPYAKDVTILH